jgi:hypothetical protein
VAHAQVESRGFDDTWAGRYPKKTQYEKAPLSAEAIDPPKPVQVIPPTNEEQNQPPVGSFNLSPERLMDGASTTTAVLTEILQQDKRIDHLRHWGINE